MFIFHFNPILCKNVLSLHLAVLSIKCQERDNNLKWLILLRVHSSNWMINFSALNCGKLHPSVPGPAPRGAFVGLAPQMSYCAPSLPHPSLLNVIDLESERATTTTKKQWTYKSNCMQLQIAHFPLKTQPNVIYPPPPSIICSILVRCQILPLTLYTYYNQK